ncbi:hypothetical protein AMJ44_11020 [candidate division WOR-1 bacterium DG_54_3]|uniref:Uncharacterized protein n=1 Tax=candidate division WOR-1 bacterium DG_54_3 TaxID=1703775 RepID=A0A0S7XRN8_UNCSA|nr:MAG: hypothetical protein AMJ44_11020 [candidate division WOR-1 bacterium DG_54_3]
MREFPFIDILEEFPKMEVDRTTQLFIISLIAFYCERQRKSKGGIVGLNIGKNGAVYKIRISENEITKKFKFGIDTIIRINEEIEKKELPIKIKSEKAVSKCRKYGRHASVGSDKWRRKYINYERVYEIKLKRKGTEIIYIPIKIIYEKKLTYTEKMALVWNLSLKAKYDRQPSIKELAKESGISERTISKAKKKYPQFFKK